MPFGPLKPKPKSKPKEKPKPPSKVDLAKKSLETWVPTVLTFFPKNVKLPPAIQMGILLAFAVSAYVVASVTTEILTKMEAVPFLPQIETFIGAFILINFVSNIATGDSGVTRLESWWDGIVERLYGNGLDEDDEAGPKMLEVQLRSLLDQQVPIDGRSRPEDAQALLMKQTLITSLMSFIVERESKAKRINTVLRKDLTEEQARVAKLKQAVALYAEKEASSMAELARLTDSTRALRDERDAALQSVALLNARLESTTGKLESMSANRGNMDQLNGELKARVSSIMAENKRLTSQVSTAEKVKEQAVAELRAAKDVANVTLNTNQNLYDRVKELEQEREEIGAALGIARKKLGEAERDLERVQAEAEARIEQLGRNMGKGGSSAELDSVREELERTLQNSESEIEVLRKNVETLGAEKEALAEKLKEAETASDVRIHYLRIQVEDLEDALEVARNERAAARQKVEILETAQQDWSKIDETEAELEEAVQRLAAQGVKHREEMETRAAEYEKELESRHAQIEALAKELKEVQRKKEESEAALIAAEAKLAEMERRHQAEVDALSQKMAPLQEAEQRARNVVSELEARLEEMARELAERQEKVGQESETLLAELEHVRAKQKATEEQLLDARAALRELDACRTAELDALQAEVEAWQMAEGAATDLVSELEERLRESDETEKTLRSREQQIHTLEMVLKSSVRGYEEMLKTKEEEFEEDIKTMEEEVRSYEETLKTKEEEMQEYEETLQSKEAQIRALRAKLEGSVREYTENLKSQEEQIARLEVMLQGSVHQVEEDLRAKEERIHTLEEMLKGSVQGYEESLRTQEEQIRSLEEQLEGSVSDYEEILSRKEEQIRMLEVVLASSVRGYETALAERAAELSDLETRLETAESEMAEVVQNLEDARARLLDSEKEAQAIVSELESRVDALSKADWEYTKAIADLQKKLWDLKEDQRKERAFAHAQTDALLKKKEERIEELSERIAALKEEKLEVEQLLTAAHEKTSQVEGMHTETSKRLVAELQFLAQSEHESRRAVQDLERKLAAMIEDVSGARQASERVEAQHNEAVRTLEAQLESLRKQKTELTERLGEAKGALSIQEAAFERELEGLRTQLLNVQQSEIAARAEVLKLETTLKEAERDRESSLAGVEKVRAEAAALQLEVDALKASKQGLAAAYEERDALTAKLEAALAQLTAAHEGNQVQQKQISGLEAHVAQLQVIHEEDQERVAALEQALAELEKAKSTSASEREEREALEAQLAETRRLKEGLDQQLVALRSQLEESETSGGARMEMLRKEAELLRIGMQSAQAEVQRLQEQITAVTSEAELQLEAVRAEYVSGMQEKQQEVNALLENLRALKEEKEGTKRELADARQRIEELEARAKRDVEALQSRVIQLEEEKQEESAQLAHARSRLEEMDTARAKQKELTAGADAGRLDELLASLEAEKEDLASSNVTLESKLARLDQEREQQAALVSRLEGQIAEKERDQQTSLALIKELRREIEAAITGDPTPTTDFWPWNDPTPKFDFMPRSDPPPGIYFMPPSDTTEEVDFVPRSDPTPEVVSMPTSDPTPEIHSPPRSDSTPESDSMPTSDLTPEIDQMATTDPTPKIDFVQTNDPTPQSDSRPKSESTPPIVPTPVNGATRMIRPAKVTPRRATTPIRRMSVEVVEKATALAGAVADQEEITPELKSEIIAYNHEVREQFVDLSKTAQQQSDGVQKLIEALVAKGAPEAWARNYVIKSMGYERTKRRKQGQL